MSLDTWENKRPYEQPIQPISLEGNSYNLPPNFVDALVLLGRFTIRDSPIETWVHIINGKAMVITNDLVVDYDLAGSDFPYLKFKAQDARILKAFASSPIEITVSENSEKSLISWADGQQTYIEKFRGLETGIYPHFGPMLDHYWNFRSGVGMDEADRRKMLRMHSGAKLSQDIYLNSKIVISRMEDSEALVSFPNNATRTMRFSRRAFLKMVKIATSIDFSVSPVCFCHAYGRGVLVEHTLGSNSPDFEAYDD